MRFAVAVAVTLAAASAGPAAAETAPDTARETAIAAWLENDEASALAGLSALAKAGDVPSALLLFVLEQRGADTPYRAGLSATERRDLLRAPGSTFGKPWVDAVPADAAPEVISALKALRARDWPKALTAALAAGDMALARAAVLGFANESPKLMFEFDAAQPLPTELRPILWYAAAVMKGQVAGDRDVDRLLAEQAAAPESLGKGAAAGALRPEADAPGSLQREALGSLLLSGRPTPPPDFATLKEAAALIAEAPEGQVLAGLCTESCPQDRDGCVVAGHTAVRGYLTLFALDSPIATVIPTERYRQSPIARADLLRAAMGSGALLSLLPETSGGACFAALVPRE